MKFTNKYGIPHAIASAIIADADYEQKSDISITQLILPPRIVQLRQRHKDKIVTDVSDRVWALMGQALHLIIQKGDDSNAFHEERIEVVYDGWRVSGRTDSYVEKEPVEDPETGKIEWKHIPPTIRDYKLIKVMAGKFAHPEWEQQLNLLAYLWRSSGFEIKRLENVLIYRDWSPSMYELEVNVKKRSYPPPIQTVPVKMWDMERTKIIFETRVAYHKAARKLSDEMLPFCTPEEQWRRDPKWAVMKPKRNSAMKVFSNARDAENFCKENAKLGAYIEFRPANAVRCENYCDVAPFCNQFAIESKRSSNENRSAECSMSE